MFDEPARHFWRPSSDGARHAFRGRRWCGQIEATSVCGAEVTLTGVVPEDEWISAATCAACNALLRSELPAASTPD